MAGNWELSQYNTGTVRHETTKARPSSRTAIAQNFNSSVQALTMALNFTTGPERSVQQLGLFSPETGFDPRLICPQDPSLDPGLLSVGAAAVSEAYRNWYPPLRCKTSWNCCPALF